VFWLQGGDLTVRNNVVDLQGVDPIIPAEPIELVWHDSNVPSAPGLVDDRVHVLNNAVYFDEATQRTVRFCAGLAGSHECRNNLAWLPNQTGRFVDDGQYSSSNNVFADENPSSGPFPLRATPPRRTSSRTPEPRGSSTSATTSATARRR
jgi:hypothetical protein